MLKIHFRTDQNPQGSVERTKQYLTNLVRRKLIAPPLTLLWNEAGGRPRNVYCRRYLNQKILKHEVTATMIADAFRSGGVTVTRKNIPLPADRYMIVRGEPHFIEVDMGTECKDQLAKVLSKYEGQPGFVLFATVSKDQMKLAMSTTSQSHIYFALIERVLGDPFGKYWVNIKNEVEDVLKPSIERP